ncbi:spatacsin [Tiliqua scincoides]|uniref:spatacsin n=1 Tax=Tiliqua scincoides TaxID=71010 RepID=UPI003461D541
MAAPLRVLLSPARLPPGDVAQARLSRGREVLGTVAAGGELRLTGLVASEESRDGSGARPPGVWRDFLWESVEENGSSADSLRLLALSKTHELCVYEVTLEVGNCLATPLHSCSEESLQKLLLSKGLSSVTSLRLLSFKNGRALVLLNHCIIAHLAFLGGEVEENGNNGFLLDLPPATLERIVDVAFCRGILFLLDKSGWIYIFDARDGVHLAHVDMSLYQAEGQEEKNLDVLPPFRSLTVSHDLSTTVITNCCSCAMAIDLNLYFKEYPDHLLCKRNVGHLRVERLEGIDEDDLRNSSCSMRRVKHAFRTDRSWKAHLSSLDDATKTLYSPALVTAAYPPWYQSLLNPEHDDYERQDASESSLLDGAVCLFSDSGGKDCKNASKEERRWNSIHLGGTEVCVKLDCKSVTGFSALFTISSETEGLVLALWDLATQDVTYSCVGKNSFFVNCSREEQLCLIFSEPGLSLVLFGLTQEEFLNRLIIHGSAGTVDTLCQLNGWGRCSIPIHALEAGLENRQLDTVDFFLKNKENLFSLSSTYYLRDQPASVMSDLYLKGVEELRPALDLLCLAIRENDLEAHSKHFSEQLLNLTLSFLNKELHDIFIHVEELDENLDRCVDVLTNYITKLRTFMIKFPQQPSSTLGVPYDLEDDVPQIKQSQIWDKLPTEQTVADAISNNQLPEAQTFFRMSRNPAQNLEELTQIGLDLVYGSLLRENIEEASKLLKNMGFQVAEQLHRICFFVSDQNVRDFLVKVLQEENCFSETEKEMIDFVHQVENVYTGAFQKNKQTVVQSRHWREERDPPSHNPVLDKFLNFSEDQVCTGVHRIILNWARCWDKVTQEMVLLPTRSPKDFKSCNPEVLWMHLTSWHDWMNISSWIAESQPQTVSTNWPQLTVEAIDQSTLCSSYMQNEILDNLARIGTFVPSELEDFECLLQRLTLTGGVMKNPHPVPEHVPASGLDFHTRFILYCLERGLDHLLYTYLDYYSLFSSNCPILDDKVLHEAHPWFEFLLQCRGVARSCGDAKRIFQASLANAQILIPSSQAGVSTMLLEGRTLLALATTMYAPGGVDRVLHSGEGGEKVDMQLFRMALAPYPRLRAALFPQHASHGILPSDISLYHLVQTLVPFDPTKLFGWQSSNTLALSDVCGDLPHFSCPSLVNKYAVLERLDFSYYLRHERPSFAFGAFLVQQLAKSKTPMQLIQQANSEAHALALSLFYAPSVAAACICFLELLGLDSLSLRVDVKAANVILSFMSRREEPQHNSIRESLVVKLMELAEGDRTAAEELLVCLEEAVWDKIEHQEMKKTSSEARKQWSLVVQFCRLHNLKLSTSYLKECARSSDWLQFLIEAQMHDYPPAEVIFVLQDFPPPLQDHLLLAFESLRATDPPLKGQGDAPHLLRHEPKQSGCPQDLFTILLRCQEQQHPWRYLLAEAVRHCAPSLCVLAVCFQGASILHGLCVWIVASLDRVTAAEVTQHVEGTVEAHDWNLLDLATLWQKLLQRQKMRTLLNGFQFFLKDSPLLMMLEVYELCTDYKNYTEAKTKILHFQASLSRLQSTDAEPPPTLPVLWLESQASFLLELMLQECQTQYELGKLLQLLADTGITLLHGPDMKRLSALSWILKDSSISIDRAILSSYTPENFQNECRRILELLQERSCFSTARAVAELAELPVDNVIVQEVLQNLHLLKQMGHWPQKRTRIEFWRKCHESFGRNAVSSQAASDFFLSRADDASKSLDEEEKVSRILERQLLLTLAGHWLAQSDPVRLDKLEGVEREIWLCRIWQQTLSLQDAAQRQPQFSPQISMSGELSFDSLAKEFSFSKLAALCVPKYLQLEGLPSLNASQSLLSDAEVESLGVLVGRLLDEGSVHEASRVCRYFDFYSRDVALVLHCRALASGESPSGGFQAEMQVILARREKERCEDTEEKGKSPKPRLHSTSSLEQWSFVEGPHSEDEIVGSLQALTAECVHGRNYCRQILCLYELSKELGCSFCEISSHDSKRVLRVILSSQQSDRCRKAQAFITTQGLDPETVAELVAEEVTQELLAPSPNKGRQKHVLNPAEESQDFLQLAKLCQDHTLVGMKLLDKISSVPAGELACTTELLILAHNCFSLTCHMEGITRVLQAARLLTDEHLAPSEEYGLVVRLLTGIGRYNEMTYIFDLLHEKHYFEVLMRKKLDPSGTLKTALLDYIKRCRPGDSEKHNMIALCFSMCREIGENHEAAANVQLKLIESRSWEEGLQDVPGLKKLLMKALTLFIDAAESYSKDFCVRQALRCNRLTKLITLQLHFLNTSHSTKLINLSPQDLLDCVMSLPRFYQAAVVAEAYDFVPDWAEVLYQHVIVKGDFNYLEEYKQRGLLKTSTFEEIARKFKQHPGSEPAVRNLKKLLTYCDDIYVYYKLAYDNQLYDVVNMLLKDAQTGCCLNDLLAN